MSDFNTVIETAKAKETIDKLAKRSAELSQIELFFEENNIAADYLSEVMLRRESEEDLSYDTYKPAIVQAIELMCYDIQYKK